MTNNIELPQQRTDLRANLIQVILLFVAVFTLSLAPILIKWSEQYIGLNAIVFNRFWISAVVLGLWKGVKSLAFQPQDASTPQEAYTIYDILLLLLTAILISISQLFLAWSLTETSVANSSLLHNMTPIFATVGGWLILKHSFDKTFIIGMALALGGAITISIQDFQIATNQLIGDSFALLSAVFYGANFLVVEKLRVKFSTISILLWSCCFRSFLTFPLVVFTEDQLFPSSLQGWLPVISLAIFCQVIGSGILFYSLKWFSSGFASLFLLLEPIITTILAWVIFAEHLSLFNGLAFLVVLVGIYVAKSGKGSDKFEHQTVTEDLEF